MTQLVVIVGPTGVGKTAVAIGAARHLEGEIVSADSQQVYRGFDIGTGKATHAQRALVPHHLLDVADPSHGFTVAQYQQLARQAIRDISSRGRRPLLVGGTGLYVRAVIDAYAFSEPARDEALRQALTAEAALLGPEALHRRLASLDPRAAGRIHPRDLRRTVRALEVWLRTGRPITAQWDETPVRSPYELTYVGITAARPFLYRLIEARVEDLFQSGLVAEVARLLEAGIPAQAPAMQALGYREVVEHLEGARSLQATVDLVKANTRRYAKRQLTWFRADRRITWLERGETTQPMELVEAIATLVAGQPNP